MTAGWVCAAQSASESFNEPSLPLAFLDLSGNAIGERGVIAIASGVPGSRHTAKPSIVEIRLQRAMPRPLTYAAVEALVGAAERCASLCALWLGEAEAAVASPDGPAARLQRALLANVESSEIGRGEATSPSAPATEDGVHAALRSVRMGKLHTLRIAHEPSAARAPLPRQLELLGAMADCSSLRVAQLVNAGLGDAWGTALADVLPHMRSLRVLDVSHNVIGSTTAQAIASALPLNHSLLWLQLLPQWLELDRSAEMAMGSALSKRRLKLDLAIRGGRGVYAARGDMGEPSVAFEWQGRLCSTGAARPAERTLNPRWDGHFTLCVPSSVLWPPSRTPLTLTLVDLRRAAQQASEPPMGSVELPLAALLLAEKPIVDVRCPIRPHPSAAPTRRGVAAELIVQLTTLHVGEACPDDDVPGVPSTLRAAVAAERRGQFEAAQPQAGWRGKEGRDAVAPASKSQGGGRGTRGAGGQARRAEAAGRGKEEGSRAASMWQLFKWGWMTSQRSCRCSAARPAIRRRGPKCTAP